MARAELARTRDRNKKTLQTPKADAGLFFVKHPKEERDPPEGGEQSSNSTPPGLMDHVTCLTTDVTVAIGFLHLRCKDISERGRLFLWAATDLSFYIFFD
jgi:hypothetical protein